MNQKYEITDIVHPQYPWLHRIRALRDVREDVHAGDLGGFVQSEEISVRKGSAGLRTMLSPPRNPIYPVTPSCGITPALVVVQSFPEKPNRWRSHHRRSCYRNLWLCPWKRPYIWKCQNLCECCYRRNPCNHGKSFCLRGAWRRDRGS